MKIKFICFCSILYLARGYCHEGNTAYFEIQVVDSEPIIIIADFPWTLRDALIEFDSTLLLDRREETWKNSFKNYISQYLKFYENNLQQLKLIRIDVLPGTQSSHSIKYKLQFEEGKISKIDNRLMFNINTDQVNYHSIKSKSGEIEFATNVQSPRYKLRNIKFLNFYSLLLVFGSIFLFLLIRCIVIKKKKNL